MSELDHRFKEIAVDPSFLESSLPAPGPAEVEEKERRQEGRAAYLRARMREVRKAMDDHLPPRRNVSPFTIFVA